MKTLSPLVASLLLMCFVLGVTTDRVYAQTTSPLNAGQTSLNPLPEPYEYKEFPVWSHSLRRFEIVSLGAFPILLFYSRIALDTGRYVGSGFDASYAPWPFRNEFSYQPGSDEQWTAAKLAIGLSLVVGVLDYYLVSKKSAAHQGATGFVSSDTRRP